MNDTINVLNVILSLSLYSINWWRSCYAAYQNFNGEKQAGVEEKSDENLEITAFIKEQIEVIRTKRNPQSGHKKAKLFSLSCSSYTCSLRELS